MLHTPSSIARFTNPEDSLVTAPPRPPEVEPEASEAVQATPATDFKSYAMTITDVTPAAQAGVEAVMSMLEEASTASNVAAFFSFFETDELDHFLLWGLELSKREPIEGHKWDSIGEAPNLRAWEASREAALTGQIEQEEARIAWDEAHEARERSLKRRSAEFVRLLDEDRRAHEDEAGA